MGLTKAFFPKKVKVADVFKFVTATLDPNATKFEMKALSDVGDTVITTTYKSKEITLFVYYDLSGCLEITAEYSEEVVDLLINILLGFAGEIIENTTKSSVRLKIPKGKNDIGSDKLKDLLKLASLFTESSDAEKTLLATKILEHEKAIYTILSH